MFRLMLFFFHFFIIIEECGISLGLTKLVLVNILGSTNLGLIEA